MSASLKPQIPSPKLHSYFLGVGFWSFSGAWRVELGALPAPPPPYPIIEYTEAGK